jgi:hypothetical protein
MTPVSENGPGRTVLDRPGEDDLRPVSVFVLAFIVLLFLVVVGVVCSHIGYKRGLAVGFEHGIMETMTRMVRPAPIEIRPGNGTQGVEHVCRAYQDAAARTALLFEDYRKTEAANRANARLLGWNDGYAVARGDWERPCLSR